MSQKYPSTWKYCATCSYWAGTRQTDYFAQWVEVEKTTETGKCMCRTSGWFNMNKGATMSCQRYNQWAPLKK